MTKKRTNHSSPHTQMPTHLMQERVSNLTTYLALRIKMVEIYDVISHMNYYH